MKHPFASLRQLTRLAAQPVRHGMLQTAIALAAVLLVMAGGPNSRTTSAAPPHSPPRIVTGSVAFTSQIIGENVDQTHAVVAADLDSDGDIDVAATDHVDGLLLWYEHVDGAFVEHILDPDLGGAYPAHVADVDQDGDPDLLSAGYFSDTYAWYRNDGGTFTRIDIDTAADGAHSITTVDLDRDGDIDLVTAEQDGNSIAWYENDGSSHFTRHTINGQTAAAKRAEVADMDGDGDLDIVTAAFDANEIAWLENDGKQQFSKHLISTEAEGAYYVAPADLDGDGDMDLFSASQLDNTIAWYQNNGTAGFATHFINRHASAARTVIASDIDGDGDVDAVSASVNDDTVAWYRNDGWGNFTELIIDEQADGVYGVFPIDMDFDGDMDVLSAGKLSNQIVLHQQIRTHEVTLAAGGTITLDGTRLQVEDADSGPAAIIYTLLRAPAHGTLRRGTVALAAGDLFTQQDVDQERIAYQHDAAAGGADEFDFTVHDSSGSGATPAAGHFALTMTAGPPAPRLQSDDFNRCALDAVRWRWLNPRGDASHALAARSLVIELPAGTPHDLWVDSMDAPRLLQSARDEDFTITVKFDTLPVAKYQMQGLVVIGGPGQLLRFDIHSFNGGSRLYVATIDGDELRSPFAELIETGDQQGITLRLVREGNQWASAYSFDGRTWQPMGTFSHDLAVQAVGLFAGNAGASPAFTMQVDWFDVAADPIADEDGAPLIPLLLDSEGGTVRIEPAQASYACGETLTLYPQPADGYLFAGWQGDLSGADVPLVVPFEIGLQIGALFQAEQADNRYQLAVAVGEGGTVSLFPPGGDYAAGTEVTLTAVPDPGRRFAGWSGDVSGDPAAATLVLTMDRNRSVAAHFEPAAVATPTPGGNDHHLYLPSVTN